MNNFFAIDKLWFRPLSWLGVLLLGIILYFSIYILRKYILIYIIKSRKQYNNFIYYFPIASRLFWFVYIIYALFIVISPLRFWGGVLFLIIIVAAWQYLIDFFNGIIFSLQDKFIIGEKIKIENEPKTLAKLNAFHIEVENEIGEIEYIKYSYLNNKNISRNYLKENILTHNFEFETSKLSLDDIYNQLLKMPWIMVSYPPKIQLISAKDNTQKFSILVYALNEKYFSYIEKGLFKYS